jgi:pimeloyl-ACP methyl ester carboxylesterase
MKSRTVVAHAMACALALSIGMAGCTNPGPGPVDPGPGPVDPGPGPDPSGGQQCGAAPTATSVRSGRGGISYSQRSISGSGFSTSTLYTPSGGCASKGAVLLIPPFMINNSALLPQAALYASNGFVVLSLNARTTGDFPASRATQGRAALTVLKQQSGVNPARIGVGGYSMGGGATMEVISSDPSIKAGVPMVPWNLGRTFPNNRVPVMIVGAQADAVAGVNSHAIPFYNSVPTSVPKGLAIVAGASHFMPSAPPAGVNQIALSWMKYFVDGDTRYRQFITQPSGMSRFNVSGL